MKPVSRRSSEGSALAVLLVSVLICASLSAAVLVVNNGRNSEAQTELAAERAFQLAEAGADWAIAQLRIHHGVVPGNGTTQDVAGSGSFTVDYVHGDADGVDEDGDGVVDNAAEHDYAALLSTGTSGTISRTVQVVVRKAIQIPAFDGAVQINVETPILDLKGNAFILDGREHLLDGTYDSTRTSKYGVSSPASVIDLLSQIDAKNADQVIGLDGSPSVGKVPAIELDKLMDQAMGSASTLIQPGTHANMTLGTPTEEGVIVAYANGDLHLSGQVGGAGILAVDGDLTISGNFEWTGVVLVRGRVTMVGGGSTKRIVGALGVGQDVSATTSSQTVSVTGTVDLDYSSDAIGLASQSLAITSVLSWREVANPRP